MALAQPGHGGDQVVQPFIVVKAADEADHGSIPDAELVCQFLVARGWVAEQRQVHSIWRKGDLFCRVAARDEVAAQAFANREHRVGTPDHAVFQRAGQAVFHRSFAAGAVADRCILPEGADLIDEGNCQPARSAQSGHAAKRRRMGMDDVGAPFVRSAFDAGAQHFDLTPFAQARRAADGPCTAGEMQPLDLFCRRSPGRMPRAGDAAHFDTLRLLCLEDGARTKGITAV